MGLFFPQRRAQVLAPHPPRDPVIAEWFGGRGTASGQSVTPATALQVTAVFACVRVLAESVASLPLILYERRKDGGKDRATSNPLFRLLHDQPNRWQTSFEFFEMLMVHLTLRGDAFAEIVAAPGRAVAELVPLHPDRVTPFWAPDSTVAYEYRLLDGPRRILLQHEVLHVRGFTDDGLTGLSPIRLHREAIGLALATEEHGARLFSNGAQLGGVLQHPGKLSAEASTRLRESWAARYAGGSNAHKTAVLEEGMTWEKVGMTSEDAQFLETRQYQTADIARIWRVPPHMIGDLSKATFSNIEHQALEFVVHTLRPWLVRWEQALKRDLITQPERFFAEFLVDGLLRGDIRSRYAAYAIGRQWGWLSANKVLEMENQNPIEGGDTFLNPMNMTPAKLTTPNTPENET